MPSLGNHNRYLESAAILHFECSTPTCSFQELQLTGCCMQVWLELCPQCHTMLWVWAEDVQKQVCGCGWGSTVLMQPVNDGVIHIDWMVLSLQPSSASNIATMTTHPACFPLCEQIVWTNWPANHSSNMVETYALQCFDKPKCPGMTKHQKHVSHLPLTLTMNPARHAQVYVSLSQVSAICACRNALSTLHKAQKRGPRHGKQTQTIRVHA